MNFDLSPLYRTAIGFDRLADMLTTAARNNDGGGYPPYNVESLGEDRYRISMAVAGFAEDELEIVVENDKLTVAGRKAAEDVSEANRQYLYRGIATRSFERRFQLADHMKVLNANLGNGLLHIELARELPETMKPRRISIGQSTSVNQVTTGNQEKRLLEAEKAA